MEKIILEECPNCGSKNQSGKKYCDYCGTLIEVTQEENKTIEQNQTTDTQEISAHDTDPGMQTSPVYSQNHNYQTEAGKNLKQQETTSGLAIASFVLAFFPIFWLIALILGIIANASISKPDSGLKGKGFSMAAIIMSSLGILSGIIIVIVIIASGVALGAMDY